MGNVSQAFLRGIVSRMPFLRVLGIGGGQFEELPSSIGNLKHLRVLHLSKNCLIKSLPDTICDLLNLECLLLDGCQQLQELPSKLHKLINLRYFSLTICRGSLVGTSFNLLPALRHMWFDSCMELTSLWDNDHIGRLSSLRSLRIVNCPKLKTLPNSMKQLVELEELLIGNCAELDLEGLCGVGKLHTLAIKGVPLLSRLPDGIQCAANSLKYLYLSDCGELAELPNWLNSCTSLQDLVILNCNNLLCLPGGISSLNSVKYLEIGGCPHISRRCAVPGGQDLSLIQHVPVIWLDGYRLSPNQQ